MPHPLLAVALLTFLAACPGPKHPQPAGMPDAAGFVTLVEQHQSAARSFRHSSRMDYRVGEDRIKATVYVMGERGAKVRFNALDPTGVTAADLACDGVNYQFIDFQKPPGGCHLTGPCTREAIAQLLRVELEPDEFLFLAIGTTPLIPGARGQVTWNAGEGRAELELRSAETGQTQTIYLDGRNGNRWDLLESTVTDAQGQVSWKLENKAFRPVKAGARTIRVPERTRFEQPAVKGDLRVRWEEQELAVELPAGAWSIDVPQGLTLCR